jgi:tyrosyl-tRNA synthetase
VPQTEIALADYQQCSNVADLVSELSQFEIYASKGEARRAIQGRALSINKVKIEDPQHSAQFELLNERYLLVGKGKKYHLLKIV